MWKTAPTSLIHTPEIILGGLELLKVALKEANITVEIEAAAEYYVDYEFEKKIIFLIQKR